MGGCHPEPNPPTTTSNLNQNTEDKKTNEEYWRDLDSPESRLRSNALIELSQQNIKSLTTKAQMMLNQDPDYSVRGVAAIALGNLQDHNSTNKILEFLKKPNEISQDVIVDALTRMKDPKAGPYLVPLLDSPDLSIRLQTIEALVASGFKDTSKIISQANKSKDEEIQKTYATLIGKLKIKEGESFLIKLSNTKEESPKLAATYLALGEIKSKSAIPILVEAMNSNFSKARENAGIALQNIGDPKSLDSLFPLLSNSNEEIRMEVAKVFVAIPNLEMSKKVSSLLSKESQGLDASSFILGRLKYEPAREKLESLFADPSTPYREMIGQSIGWIQNRKSLPLLQKVALEKDGQGKYGALWSLGIIPDESSLSILETAYNQGDGRSKVLSLESMGMIHSEKSIPFLKDVIKKDENLAIYSIFALGAIPGDKSWDVLADSAKAGKPGIRKVAIQELGNRKEPKSTEVLISLLDENDAELKKMIYFSLTSITGYNYRTKGEWITWWEKNKP